MKNGRKYSYKIIKEIVAKKLNYKETVNLSDVVEIIRPFYAWKKHDLVERELNKTARTIMRSFKDTSGVRTYFSQQNGVFINIEKSTDLEDLEKIDIQLTQKYTGLSAALKKVRNRIAYIFSKYSGANSKES
jgi:hypothetical protein